ncbi:MAG: protocatechuate 3,4-dioxygenase, partial [Myxococcales bacterium]|nr:protocatechuate 3,4-dioxygenase [Myxococcales bacterium]
GWYPGRAVHIHFKVHLPGNMEVTSQLYFPDAINAAAYTDPPYDQRGNADTPNAQDGILNGTADGGTLLSDVAAVAGGFAGSLTIGIL